MSDEEITRAATSDPDALPLDDPFFAAARRLSPQTLLKENKQQITLRIDADVLDWFRTLGSGYQSRMNAVLKAYVQTHTGYNRQKNICSKTAKKNQILTGNIVNSAR